jgi:hypothetical protein
LILKLDKVVCFARLLQVLILKRLMGNNHTHRNAANRLRILQVLKMNDLGHVDKCGKAKRWQNTGDIEKGHNIIQ